MEYREQQPDTVVVAGTAAAGDTAVADGTAVVGATAVVGIPDRTVNTTVEAPLGQTFMAVLKSHMTPEDPSVTIRELPGRTETGIKYQMIRPIPEMLQSVMGTNHVVVHEEVTVAPQCVMSVSSTPIPRMCNMDVRCTYRTSDANPNHTSVKAEVRVKWISAQVMPMVRDIVLDTAVSWVHREVDFVARCLSN